jgi:hypothetical protein
MLEGRREIGHLEDEARKISDPRLLRVIADIDHLSAGGFRAHETDHGLHRVAHVAERAPLLRPVEPEGIFSADGPK